jgi:2-(1,2-epoxy-1,2-dihydrophenyl)acetyl-CoA isomerase
VTEHLHYDVGPDGVGRITLDRPDAKNALTIEMRDAIVDAVRAARGDDAVRALLLTGTGDAFCAGMDLTASTVANASAPDYQNRSTAEALRVGVQSFIRELWELDKPTVAAVNGAAVGAYLLPRLVGLPRAKAMVMLGEGATGDEAVALGLAYRCVPETELADVAGQLAAQLAAGPTRSLGLSKRLLNASFETDLAHSLDLEGSFQSLAATSSDLAEGMAAFRDRRDPKFTGT